MRRRYSLSYLTYLDAPPPEAVRIAAEAGYDFVGLRLLPAAPGGVAYRLQDCPADLKATRAALHATGIQVLDIEMIRIDASFQAEGFHPFLEASAELGARAILVAGDDENEARLTENYAHLCEAAAPLGLTTDLEFMPQSKVTDARAALRIVQAAGRANAGIIVDALHVSRSRTRPADLTAIPRRWLHYAQICDGPAEIPGDLNRLNHAARHARLLPGDGAIALGEIFAAMPSDLPIAVEVPNDRLAPPLGALEWARRGLHKARAILEGVHAD